MAIVDLFFKRQEGISDSPDVYEYDEIPDKFRVQVVHILNRSLGTNLDNSSIESAYRFIVEVMREEMGVFCLLFDRKPDFLSPYDELRAFLVDRADTKHFLSLVELSFKIIDRGTRTWDYMGSDGYNQRADAAINDLNVRFKENKLGYQFVDGEIIRIDSELIHAEAVKPALRLLNSPGYQGPQEEFRKAYDHYRNGENKEALNFALKAFESTMKAICEKRGWTYNPGDTAKGLIKVCLDKGLIPSFWQNQMAHLIGLLESSVPTGRNKLGGHGQGATPVEVPDYLTAYMLHMTASTLVFLTTAEKELP